MPVSELDSIGYESEEEKGTGQSCFRISAVTYLYVFMYGISQFCVGRSLRA